MNLQDIQIATTVIFVVWGFVLALAVDAFSYRTSKVYKIHVAVYFLLLAAYIPTKGWEETSVYRSTNTSVKVLVSAQPSHTQLEGSFIGFMFFSGVINERRVYLLREEIEPGLYKDFEVAEEVYIKEDDGLTDKGKFVKYYICKDYTKYLDLYGWRAIEFSPKRKCTFDRQVIEVPKGAVIKELKI